MVVVGSWELCRHGLRSVTSFTDAPTGKGCKAYKHVHIHPFVQLTISAFSFSVIRPMRKSDVPQGGDQANPPPTVKETAQPIFRHVNGLGTRVHFSSMVKGYFP